MKKTIIIINIFLVSLIIIISIREDYYGSFLKKYNYEDTYQNNWKYRQELGFYQYYIKKGQVVMFGNSITYRVNWNELLNRDDIINRGIGGDITEGFLSRIEHVINVNPKLCFIMGGVNDLAKGYDSEIVVNNLLKITNILKDNEIKPFVYSILYVAETFPNYKKINTKINQTNRQIEIMCNDYGVDFIDLNIILSKNNELLPEYSFDGIHLTGLGYSKWREKISPIIEWEIQNFE